MTDSVFVPASQIFGGETSLAASHKDSVTAQPWICHTFANPQILEKSWKYARPQITTDTSTSMSC